MAAPRWLKAIMWWRKKIETPTQNKEITLSEVFTPSAPANKSYVPRPTQEDDLRRALATPGTQTVVYGESGAGKTSLTIRVLRGLDRPYVTTHCDTATTYEDVLASGLHKIAARKPAGNKSIDTRVLHGKGGIPEVIEAGTEWQISEENETAPFVDAPKTAENLAELLGRKGLVWVIEDFHKTSPETKASLSHALKIFSDLGPDYPRTQVVVLGAADTPVEVWGTPEANLRDRLAYIELPPLNDDELGAVLDTGAQVLNVDFSAVRNEIIRHSVGLAGITHGLAHECCYVAGVQERRSAIVAIDTTTLATAKANYSRTRQVEIKDRFDKALLVKRSRTYDNHTIILKALAALGEHGGTHAEIYAAIKRDYPQYPSGNLTLYLRELQTEDRGAIVRKTRTGQFRFEKPLMHSYARQLFNIASAEASDDFWSDIKASDEAKALAALRLEQAEDSQTQGL